MDNLVVCANKKLTIDKFVSQVKVVSQSMIKKILNISADSFINSCDMSGGSIAISGKIRVDVLYLTMENKIEAATGESDYIEKQKIADELSDVFANDVLTVFDVNYSSNEIICSVSHNTEINGIYRYQVPNFASDNSNIVENKTNFNSLKFVCSAEDYFSVSEENDSNLKDIDILKVNSQVVIDSVLSSVDKFIVDGRVLCEFIYRDGENISTGLKQIEFKQEVKAETVIPNMKAIAFAKIKTNSVLNEINDEKSLIAYNFEVFLKCFAYEETSCEVANDLFDLKYETTTVYDYLEIQNYCETIEQSESFLSQTDITSVVDFDDIIGVFEPKIEVVNIENFEDKTEILSKISVYVLYRSQDNIEKLEIVKDFRFEIVKDFDKIINKIELNCQTVSYKVKAGKEIEIVLKINCHADLVSQFATRFVKSYENISEKDADQMGIKVYVTRNNQTIFDIAKALNVKPDLIKNQNQVEDVFEAGKKVYVYTPINLV